MGALLLAVILGPATQAAGERDPFERAILVEGAQFNFEAGGDLDYDGQPDDWTRRRGPGFPHYVTMEIDPEVAHEGSRSLRVEANGGKAAYYSEPVAISPHHSYIFAGHVRTDGLVNDAAMITVSFLNARQQRVRRVVGPPVSGSSERWSEVRIGPVMPTEDVRYVVLGVHLVHGEEMDYHGRAWFDSFSLRMLPRLSLKTNFETQFRGGMEPIDSRVIVSGLDEDGSYKLHLFLENAGFRVIEEKWFDLSSAEYDPSAPLVRRWSVPAQVNGFYRLHAHLLRDGEVMLEEVTSLAVVEPADRGVGSADNRPAVGGFGWSMETWPHDMDHDRLLTVASEAGIDWIKLPLWNTLGSEDNSPRVAQLLAELRRRNVRPAGILREPPREIRRKFADDWAGVSELFTMPPSFWVPSIDPVMARYSAHVHHWQLGGESDESFATLPRLPGLLTDVKAQFDRLGRDVSLGVHWRWGRPIPKHIGTHRPFLSLSSRPALGEAELVSVLEKSADSGFHRWVLLRPKPRTLSPSRLIQSRDLDGRASDLLRRIVAARIGRADVTFASDIFHPRIGMLREDGSPSELFLPWRTAALALRGADYLGSFRLPNRSTNHVFAKGEEAVVFAWANERNVEKLHLGPDLRAVNIWGQTSELEEKEGRHLIPVERVPNILRGGSARMAKFRLSTRFEKSQMPSSTDEWPDELVLENPFPQGVSGHVNINVPREWEVRPRSVPITMKAGQTVRVPLVIRVPSHTSLGPQPVKLDFELDADNFYKFRVMRDYTVGLGDVEIGVATEVLENGDLEVRQTITNHTEEVLDFRVSLFVPGQKRLKRRVAQLSQGESNQITYRVPRANSLVGKMLRIRAEQEGGNRVLNKSWTFEGR